MIPAPSRRWFRFSLRTLWALVIAAAVASWFVHHEMGVVSERKTALHIIKHQAMAVGTLYSAEEDRLKIPFWRRWMGDRPVNYIVVFGSEDDLRRMRNAFPEANVEWKKGSGVFQ